MLRRCIVLGDSEVEKFKFIFQICSAELHDLPTVLEFRLCFIQFWIDSDSEEPNESAGSD